MEKMTNWTNLWKELVIKQDQFRHHGQKKKNKDDTWKDKAKKFDAKVKERWRKQDPHRDFIISEIKKIPDATVLDIGAGTGSWAMLISRVAKKVTALEPSEGMRQVLQENLDKENIRNVEIVNGEWPGIDIQPHDFTLSSHSAYGCSDFPGFIDAMTKNTNHTCFMLLRAPSWNGLMAEAANRIWGHPNDSPNFQIAYGVMLEMGMFPNVLMEGEGFWPAWSHDTFDEALTEMRSRFGLPENSEHESFIFDLMKERLEEKEDRYYWPVDVRSALLYWGCEK